MAADQLITDSLPVAFPDHRVLSEKPATPGWTANGFARPLWVVDPIDGTANYTRRLVGHMTCHFNPSPE